MIRVRHGRISLVSIDSKKIWNFQGEIIMSKLKVLLIAGLLSLTSVSFASSVVTLGDPNGNGSVGTISLINGDSGVTLGGLFDNTGSVFYELAINEGIFASTGMSFDVGPPVTLFDVTISIYDTYANLLAGVGSALYSDTNNLSAALVAETNYFLQINGVADTSYNVKVSAVPVPAAGILFASALFGAGVYGRRKKKSSTTLMVGAFTRAS